MQELRVISIAKNKLHTEQTVISHMPKKFVVFQSDAKKKKRNKTTYYILSISVKICIPAHFLRLREISLLAYIYLQEPLSSKE